MRIRRLRGYPNIAMAQQSLARRDRGAARPAAAEPEKSSRAAAADCKACPLWKTGTRRSSGRDRRGPGPLRRRAARRPGGSAGRPFVGPAGRLLDRALDDAGSTGRTSTSRTPSSTSSGCRGQAAHPPDAPTGRSPRMPPLAGGRDLRRHAARARLPRRDRHRAPLARRDRPGHRCGLERRRESEVGRPASDLPCSSPFPCCGHCVTCLYRRTEKAVPARGAPKVALGDTVPQRTLVLGLARAQMCAATVLRSVTNFASSASRSSARRIDDGWTVAITTGASPDSTGSPRCCVTRNCRPRSACAAVAPRQTRTRGLTTASSASSHGRAGGDLRPVRLLVDASLALALPLEVLDDVRHVCEGAVDAGFLHRLVEEAARGPDERLAGPVLLVAGLLADEHDVGLRRAFAEDRLRPGFPERAGLAAGRCLAELPQARPRRDERGGGLVEQALLGHRVLTDTQEARIPFDPPAPWPRG